MNLMRKCWKSYYQINIIPFFENQARAGLCQHKNCLLSRTNVARSFSSNVTEDLDDNERALKELDITLLKPHPEWRNVAAGPVWGKDHEYFDILWKPWLNEPHVKKYQRVQDQEWEDYIEKFGESPIDYLSTDDYIELYEDNVTWFNYRRNRKGFIPRQKTRRNCKIKGVISCGSPCPVCRDPRLLMTYKNLPLLNQYIDHQTGKLHQSLRTGLCRAQHRVLMRSFAVAKELGYLQRVVPFVKFDFKDFKLNQYVV